MLQALSHSRHGENYGTDFFCTQREVPDFEVCHAFLALTFLEGVF